eukprot:TRINITY_DN566_c0_g1_i2.p1 TRINITY_DN566_c0_g1~~TRINITY_DN566_c0_g1_i2.p1  ORF type:complete len:460 (+),score=126.05 TRINITY_DN566_c0_g1_i2:129-1508(+)
MSSHSSSSHAGRHDFARRRKRRPSPRSQRLLFLSALGLASMPQAAALMQQPPARPWDPLPRQALQQQPQLPPLQLLQQQPQQQPQLPPLQLLQQQPQQQQLLWQPPADQYWQTTAAGLAYDSPARLDRGGASFEDAERLTASALEAALSEPTSALGSDRLGRSPSGPLVASAAASGAAAVPGGREEAMLHELRESRVEMLQQVQRLQKQMGEVEASLLSMTEVPPPPAPAVAAPGPSVVASSTVDALMAPAKMLWAKQQPVGNSSAPGDAGPLELLLAPEKYAAAGWAAYALTMIVAGIIYNHFVRVHPPPEVPGGQPEIRANGWQHGIFDCGEDPGLCCFSCFFGPVRWAETMRMGNYMGFWTALLVLLLCMFGSAGTVALTLPPCAILLMLYYRQRIRKSFNMPAGTCITCCDDLFAVWCCTVCTIVQEARQLEQAWQAKHAVTSHMLAGEPVAANR